jgi:hypothetical protein
MTTPEQNQKYYQVFGDLKRYLRLVLDPERVRTPMDSREALAESQALIYRVWREHLEVLSQDDGHARNFFNIFPFTQFLYDICRDATRNPPEPVAPLPDKMSLGELKFVVAQLEGAIHGSCELEEFVELEPAYQVARSVVKLGESLAPLLKRYEAARLDAQYRAKQNSESLSDQPRDEALPATSGKEQDVPVSFSSMDARTAART